MPSAIDALISNPPSEHGGARASNRFDFQKDWTFCLLLQLHVTGKDYLVVCDYHDDVLVLDGETAPTRVDFFQVKTSTAKRWSITKLLHQEQGESGLLPSVLGKLYRHRLKFGALVGSTNFVTNLPFSIKLPAPPTADSRTEFTFIDLSDSDKEKIKNALQAELALASGLILNATMAFHVTDLSLKDHRTHTRGKLSDYLEKRDPSRTYPVQAIYRTIVDEIGRRTADETPCTAVIDLLRLKSISRKDLEYFITTCIIQSDRPDPRVVAESLESNLASEGVPFTKRRAIRRSLERYSIQRMDSSQTELTSCAATAQAFVAEELLKHQSTLWDFIQRGRTHVSATHAGLHLDDNYVMAIIAWEVLANDAGQISSTSSKSSAGDK